ncbi:hypothetical protein [Parendozoicomonas haliclonae]|uniref:Uncharacterized protein n=1 Tax=Parendozoicomonas haliclonae TaxID=1960125 RepID=A0A1X7AIR5_9GAMM|nr:hypothetical protein [Parendozoicomonas haliclonae]SMA45385.1 hypothetical protein EHSB41UT_01910 [Parendozoicomonas haliclonae]
MIGLCGANKNDKITLAKQISQKEDFLLISIDEEKILTSLGMKLGENYSFSERLGFYQSLLSHAEKEWSDTNGNNFITDFTPLDIAARLMVETANTPLSAMEQATLYEFRESCEYQTEDSFTATLYVEPTETMMGKIAEKPGDITASHRECLDAVTRGLMYGTYPVGTMGGSPIRLGVVSRYESEESSRADSAIKLLDEVMGIFEIIRPDREKSPVH